MGKIPNRKMDCQPKDSTEEIRGWLYAIIEAELNKDEEQIDYELIQECSDLDAYLAGNESPLGEEEYQQGLQLIQSKTTVRHEENAGLSSPVLQKKKRWSVRVAIIAAAVLIVMFSTIAVVATSQGLSVADFISENIKKITSMKPGETIQGDKITLIKGETTAEYSSVEEAIAALEVDILYPTTMPKDVKVEEIIMTHYGAPSIYKIIFITNKPDEYGISVNNEILTHPENWQHATKHEVNGIAFYVLTLSDGTYQAVGHQNGFEYQIFAANMDDLLTIVNGMKG